MKTLWRVVKHHKTLIKEPVEQSTMKITAVTKESYFHFARSIGNKQCDIISFWCKSAISLFVLIDMGVAYFSFETL